MHNQIVMINFVSTLIIYTAYLRILLKNGLIVKEETDYRLNDTLLRIFINRLYSIPEF